MNILQVVRNLKICDGIIGHANYTIKKQSTLPNAFVKQSGFLSEELQDELESLFNDDYVLGIYQSDHNDELVKETFIRGIVNRNSFFSQNNTQPNIKKILLPYDDFLSFSREIKKINNQRESNGIFIIKIPKENLNLKNDLPMPLYYKDTENIVRILPEYIYGYICRKSGATADITRNSYYRDIHEYIPSNNMIYDVSVNDRLFERGKSL